LTNIRISTHTHIVRQFTAQPYILHHRSHIIVVTSYIAVTVVYYCCQATLLVFTVTLSNHILRHTDI